MLKNDELFYTVIDADDTVSEQTIHFNINKNGVSLDMGIRIGPQQLAELGWLFIAIARQDVNGQDVRYDAVQLINGYGYETPPELN